MHYINALLCISIKLFFQSDDEDGKKKKKKRKKEKKNKKDKGERPKDEKSSIIGLSSPENLSGWM